MDYDFPYDDHDVKCKYIWFAGKCCLFYCGMWEEF